MKRLLLHALILLPLTAIAAEPLGRLFYSPEQRVQLDSLRAKKVAAVQTKDEPPPEFVSYGGLVRREDGRTTVWVNNKAMTEKDVREATSLVGRIERDGRITVQPAQGSTAPALKLKVGQSAELLSGRVAERFSEPPRTDKDKSPQPAARPDAKARARDDDSDLDSSKPPASPSAAALLREASKISPTDPEAAAKLKALADAAR